MIKDKLKIVVGALLGVGGVGGISLIPIIIAGILTVSTLGGGVVGLLWILNKEDPQEESKSDKCTCEFLSEEEIDMLNKGVTITLPDGGTISGNTPSPGTGNGSANITGEVIAGDYVNELFWFLKNLNESYFGVPVWVIYGINSVEDSGSIFSKNPFKEGLYTGLDSALTLKAKRSSYAKGAAGIWQMEYNSSNGFLNRINGKEQEVADFYKTIGIDITKYPGPLTDTYEYIQYNFRTWDKDPLYIPGATYGFLATLKEQHDTVVSAGLLDFPELESCTTDEKEFIGWLLTMTAWNNNVGQTTGTMKKNYKQDATVRKVFVAFAKLMGDTEIYNEFKNTTLSDGGNLSSAVRNWVVNKAVEKGYLTSDDKKYIDGLPNYKGMYFDNEIRAREIQYSFNGVHYIMNHAEPKLLQHGITVVNWGFLGNKIDSGNSGKLNSAGNALIGGALDTALNAGSIITGGIAGTPIVPQTGVGSIGSTATGNTMKLMYSTGNMDGGTVEAEYPITECKPIKIKHMPVNLTGEYPKSMATMNGLVVHFNAGPASIGGIFSTFNNSSTASQFDVDNTGAVAMYLPLNQYAICSNSENGRKIGIEVGNLSLDDPQYSAQGYESLVHLVAYLCVELNFDLDFNFIESRSGSLFRDTGTVMRHYDVTSSNQHYAKGCPAYYCPTDGSVSNAGSNNTISNGAGHAIVLKEGGNTRWISFKTEVIKYILKYKDDPNFKITMEDGSDILGLEWAKSASTGKFNWNNPALAQITNIEGDGTGFSSPVTGNTGGNSNNNNTTTSYAKKGRAYTTSCQMDRLGYCGCYRGDNTCKCGCGGSSDAPWIDNTGGGGSTGVTDDNTSNSGSTGGTTIGGTDAPQYDSNNGLSVPAQRQYTMEDVKSTGGQRVIDTALVTFQQMYIAGSQNLGKCPLYTQNRSTSSYNYSSLAQPGFTTASGQKVSGRFDCSAYVGAVISNMGCTLLSMPNTNTLVNADLSSFGFQKLTYDINSLQPGDIVVQKDRHAEIFAGWADQNTHMAYAYGWGGSQRLSNYDDGKGYRGKANGADYIVSGMPGANNNTPGALITGPATKSYEGRAYDIIFRFTGN